MNAQRALPDRIRFMFVSPGDVREPDVQRQDAALFNPEVIA
jgi:hypothetical protein